MRRIAALLLALTTTPARAQSPAPDSPIELGGLHRVGAVLESTLDIHRLALIELAPAARKLLEAGQRPEATPATLLPPAAAEVLARLALSLPARVPARSLPAVARAYEAEAVEALEALGRAKSLGSLAASFRAYIESVEHLLAGGDEVLELFSRMRPVQARVIDPDLVLDDIHEALDELARAEQAIDRTRARKRPMSEQLQSFIRLEAALGHALDLIASAQEAGVHIGFEAPAPTASLSATIRASRAHLQELDAAVREMERPPAPLAGELEALVVAAGDGPPYEARLTWQAADPSAPPAALRVYRQPNKLEAVHFLTSVLTCDSGDAAAASQAAQTQLGDVDAGRELVGEVSPGRSSLTETVGGTGRFYAPPRYTVVPVSAFGVEGSGPEATAFLLPRTIEPPPMVTATLGSRSPADPAFYRDGDLVRIEWEPARGELARPGTYTDVAAWAKERALPVVRSYRVLRIAGDTVAEVTVVGAGVHAAVDRPPLADLAHGVSYYVETITDYGRAAQTPGPCKQTELRADTERAFAAAAAGIGYVRHPTSVEREALTRLAAPAALNAALTSFAARPAPERERLLETWWTSLTGARRRELLARFPAFVSKGSREAWLLEGARHLSERDLPWVATELWLAAQPPFMQREIDRYWSLLDRETQQRALDGWRARLDAEHGEWVGERLAAGDEGATRPARVLAWWSSRDGGERERILDWWATAPSAEEQRLFRDWLADQAPVVRAAVRWPDWSQRSERERTQLVAAGFRDLPDGLMVHVLAWLDWHALEGEALDRAVAAEITFWQRLSSRTRFALRPLDRALGFHLWTLTASIALLLPVAFVARRLRRRRLPFLR